MAVKQGHTNLSLLEYLAMEAQNRLVARLGSIYPSIYSRYNVFQLATESNSKLFSMLCWSIWPSYPQEYYNAMIEFLIPFMFPKPLNFDPSNVVLWEGKVHNPLTKFLNNFCEGHDLLTYGMDDTERAIRIPKETWYSDSNIGQVQFLFKMLGGMEEHFISVIGGKEKVKKIATASEAIAAIVEQDRKYLALCHSTKILRQPLLTHGENAVSLDQQIAAARAKSQARRVDSTRQVPTNNPGRSGRSHLMAFTEDQVVSEDEFEEDSLDSQEGIATGKSLSHPDVDAPMDDPILEDDFEDATLSQYQSKPGKFQSPSKSGGSYPPKMASSTSDTPRACFAEALEVGGCKTKATCTYSHDPVVIEAFLKAQATKYNAALAKRTGKSSQMSILPRPAQHQRSRVDIVDGLGDSPPVEAASRLITSARANRSGKDFARDSDQDDF